MVVSVRIEISLFCLGYLLFLGVFFEPELISALWLGLSCLVRIQYTPMGILLLKYFLMNAWYFWPEVPEQPNYCALCELCLRSHSCLTEKLSRILLGIDLVKLYLSDPRAMQHKGACRDWLDKSQCLNMQVIKAGNSCWRQNWPVRHLGQATRRCTLVLVWKK